MLSGIAIKAEKLSKIYKLYNSPVDRVKESLHPLRRQYHNDFYALNDVSFEIRKGESVGIIGKNGSGKSTLLKILAGVLTPTSGSVTVNGKVSALLELGAGFNPELTGLENVYFNGMLMGYTREEIRERLNDILLFADIGDFVHQPVKTYSSGMFIRLAFATFTVIEPEILIIDEALAVGDVSFRQKCYQRINMLKENGVTIVLVSHAFSDIIQMCQRSLLMNRGAVAFQGDSSRAVKKYFVIEQNDILNSEGNIKSIQIACENQIQNNSKFLNDQFITPTDEMLNIQGVKDKESEWAKLVSVGLMDGDGESVKLFRQGEYASIIFGFEILKNMEVPVGGVAIYNDNNILVHAKSTLEYGTNVPLSVLAGSKLIFRQNIKLDLQPGDYTFCVGLATMNNSNYSNRSSFINYEIDSKIMRLCYPSTISSFTVTLRSITLPVQLTHRGLCNLPGTCEVHVNNPINVDDTRIIIAEYPKSGGSWFVSMLGDALGIPKRDIYVDENYTSFDVKRHPWYIGDKLALTKSCVIKSHEYPESPLHNFPAKYVHLIRDGRDVVVSKYFYEKNFCVNNGILKSFNMSFDDYVAKIASEWKHYVNSWSSKNVVICKYENLLECTENEIIKTFELLEISVPKHKIENSINNNTKDKLKESTKELFKDNTFVRKGISGDWANHFSDKNKNDFKLIAGDLLMELGYEKDMNW